MPGLPNDLASWSNLVVPVLWAIVAIVFLTLFRRPIAAALGRLTRLKVWLFEADFAPPRSRSAASSRARG